MSQSYSGFRCFSDQLIMRAFPVLGKNFVRIAPEFKDMNENVDLEVLATDVAFRVRKWEDRCYKGDFTIRSKVKSGRKTELDKIISGFGRYLFYAISNKNKDGFHCFALIDLNVFRSIFYKTVMENKGEIPLKWKERANGDGSYFRPFKYTEFPDSLLIDQQGLNEMIKEEEGTCKSN